MAIENQTILDFMLEIKQSTGDTNARLSRYADDFEELRDLIKEQRQDTKDVVARLSMLESWRGNMSYVWKGVTVILGYIGFDSVRHLIEWFTHRTGGAGGNP